MSMNVSEISEPRNLKMCSSKSARVGLPILVALLIGFTMLGISLHLLRPSGSGNSYNDNEIRTMEEKTLAENSIDVQATSGTPTGVPVEQ